MRAAKVYVASPMRLARRSLATPVILINNRFPINILSISASFAPVHSSLANSPRFCHKKLYITGILIKN